MSPFRNTPCMLRRHLVQFGCFLSINLIAKCAEELTASISNFLLMEVTDINGETGIKGQIMAFMTLKFLKSYGSWVLLLPPLSLLPSHTPGTAVGGRLPSSVMFSFGSFLEEQTAVLGRLGLAWLAAPLSQQYLTTPLLGWCWESPGSGSSHWDGGMLILQTLKRSHYIA